MQNEQKTSIENFDPNVVAAFSYIIPPLTGIIFFLLEKKSRFVRFHAIQSILFGAVMYAAMTFIGSLRVFYIGYVLQPFVTLLGFGLWLLLIWKAYQNEEYHLPYIGKIAWEYSSFEKKSSTSDPKTNDKEPTDTTTAN
jgi:uncharacterized membrane protein